MLEITCSLAGTPLYLAFRDARLLQVLEPVLQPLKAPLPLPPGFRCELRLGDPAPVPADALIHFEGTPPPADGPCILGARNNRRFLIFPGRASIVASLEGGWALAIVRPGEEKSLAGIAVMHLLDWVLEADGRTLVHGAALAVPREECGILLFGPSGAGKTTLALALLKAGFSLFSDDLAVLAHGNGQPRLGGLGRPVKVHRETAKLMPWLAPWLLGEWDADGEQLLAPETAAGIGRLAHRPVPLAGIVRIAGRRPDDHVLQPVSPSEALMRLCSENLRTGIAGTPDFERRTFRRLGRVVSQVPAYDLWVGRELAAIASHFARAGLAARSPEMRER